MEVITGWDSELHGNSDAQKTPTAISFAPKAKVNYGYEIPCNAKQVK